MGQWDMVIGVLLIGLFLNTYLYGLVTYQFIVYHNTKFNDKLWIRGIVGSLFVIDTVQSAVVVYAGWEMCVTNYNNPASLSLVSWTIPFTAVANSFASIICQFFLGHRVFVLTKNKPLIGAIAILSFTGWVFGVYAGIYSGILRHIAKFPLLDPFVIVWLGSQTAADILITCSLIFVLSRSRTGFRRTDTVINRIIRGAVQTGFFVSVFALADLFSFVLHRNSNLYALFAYPLGRIYTNTLLDTLNARSALSKVVGATETYDSEEVSYRMQTQTHTIGTTTAGGQSMHVQKEVITNFTSTTEDIVIDNKYQVHEP